MPDVVVSSLRKEFAGSTVLHSIDLHIRDGEFFTLLGPSGCGKSTTLACIAGLERPTSGTLSVGGATFVDDQKFVPPEERDLGMVFQSYALWPHMTLAQNLAVPLNIRKVPRSKQKALIADALDQVGLAHLAHRYPHQLSGGQQQRVALARALVYEPKVLLLDEPLSNLDAKLREQARVWLKKLQADLGITTVYVTHDQEEALAMSDRIAVMSQGRLLQVGTPHEIYEKPTSAEVNAFIGRSNFIDGVVARADSATMDVALSGSGRVTWRLDRDPDVYEGESVTMAFRPERTRISALGAGAAGDLTLPARVVAASYVGTRYNYDLIVDDTVLVADHHSGSLDGDVEIGVTRDAVRVYPRRSESSDTVTALIVGSVH